MADMAALAALLCVFIVLTPGSTGITGSRGGRGGRGDRGVLPTYLCFEPGAGRVEQRAQALKRRVIRHQEEVRGAVHNCAGWHEVLLEQLANERDVAHDTPVRAHLTTLACTGAGGA